MNLQVQLRFILSILACANAWVDKRPLKSRLDSRASLINPHFPNGVASRSIFGSRRRVGGVICNARPSTAPTRFFSAKMSSSIASAVSLLVPPPLSLAETISVEHSSAREAFALRYLMSFTALRVVSISAAFGGAVYRYLPRLCKWLYEDMKTDPMERALHATGRFMPISAKFRSDKRDNGASTKESQTMFSDAALDALTNKDLGFRTRVEMFLVRSFLDIPIIKRLGHNLNEAYINITSKITM